VCPGIAVFALTVSSSRLVLALSGDSTVSVQDAGAPAGAPAHGVVPSGVDATP